MDTMQYSPRWLGMGTMFGICLVMSLTGCDSLPNLPTPEPPPTQPNECPSWAANQTITVTQNTTLPKGCYYNKVSFVIQDSNITFDCNDAILNGSGFANKNPDFIPYAEANLPVNIAFQIVSPEGRAISDITIRNCQIKNYVDGVRIKSVLNNATIAQLKSAGDGVAIEEGLRKGAPQNIQLQNLNITDSHKHGVYLDRYVHHVAIVNGSIKNSGNSAIYLESGTQNISVRQMLLEHNGHSSYDRDKKMSLPRLGDAQREAIAVDSSANNEIVSNTFRDNAGGGVFLYKNCYEKHTETPQMPRLQHSDNNVISDNQFFDEETGVWIASRQSRDLASFNCGDPVVYREAGQQFYEDFAEHNRISGNTFTNVEAGVKVEDDNNQVINNRFMGKGDVDIQVGSRVRSALKHPVQGVDLNGNVHQSSSHPAVAVLPLN